MTDHQNILFFNLFVNDPRQDWFIVRQEFLGSSPSRWIEFAYDLCEHFEVDILTFGFGQIDKAKSVLNF